MPAEQYAPWAEAYGRWHVKDYKPWREHRLQKIARFKDVPIGKLTEEEIDSLKPIVTKAASGVKKLIAEQRQKSQHEMALIGDVSYLQFGIAHLDHYRKELAGAAPAAPAPEAKTESVPAKPSKELALVKNNGQLANTDMVLSYLRAQRRELLSHSKSLDELAKEVKKAKEIERLAQLMGDIDDSKQIAVEAGAWECDARYERSKLIEVLREQGVIKTDKGSAKKGGKPLSSILPAKNDRNWNAVLSKLSPEEYQVRLDAGLEAKTLSQRSFLPKNRNAHATGISQKKSKPLKLRGPRDFLMDLCVDMGNTNLASYPLEGEYFEAFVNDQILMENFRPVAKHLALFVMRLFEVDHRNRHGEEREETVEHPD